MQPFEHILKYFITVTADMTREKVTGNLMQKASKSFLKFLAEII